MDVNSIFVDTREKPHAIQKILAHVEREGREVIRQKLDVGDYMLAPDGRISVDRKQNLLEVTANVCQQHERFSAECLRASRNGVQLVFLVEHGGRIKSLEDVQEWRNPRLDVSPYAVSGPRLYRMVCRCGNRDGVQWEFCGKQQTGKRILDILSRG